MAKKKAGGVQVPWDDIPERSVFPTMDAGFKVTGDVTWGPSSKKGYKTFVIPCTITSGPYKKMPYYMRFTVGMEKDTEATDPKTWTNPMNVGARQFMQSAKAMGIKVAGKSDEEVAELMSGCEFGMKLVKKTQKGGDYDGQEQNNPGEFYPYGQREAKVYETGESTAPKAKRGKPISTGRSKGDDDDDGDDDEDEEDEAPRKAKAKAKAKRPEPDEDDDEDEEDEDPTPKRRRKAAVDDDDEEEDEDEGDDDDDDTDDEDDDDDEPRPRRARGKR